MRLSKDDFVGSSSSCCTLIKRWELKVIHAAVIKHCTIHTNVSANIGVKWLIKPLNILGPYLELILSLEVAEYELIDGICNELTHIGRVCLGWRRFVRAIICLPYKHRVMLVSGRAGTFSRHSINSLSQGRQGHCTEHRGFAGGRTKLTLIYVHLVNNFVSGEVSHQG